MGDLQLQNELTCKQKRTKVLAYEVLALHFVKEYVKISPSSAGLLGVVTDGGDRFSLLLSAPNIKKETHLPDCVLHNVARGYNFTR